MKVLVAEGDAVSRRVLEVSLERWGYEVIATGDGHEAFEILTHVSGPSLAVIDWMVPEINGPELCRRVREAHLERYIYIVLLSAHYGGQHLIEGLESGADDYINKPWEPSELKVRLHGGLRVLELQNELMMTREALRDQATFDDLTGAHNRGAILDLLERELHRSRRSSEPVTVMMCDVDHFKQVNDTFGHPAGDRVLANMAAQLRSGVRFYDFVGRYGGEEFLLVLPGCDRDEAMVIAERLRASLAATATDVPEGSIVVTCSFGVASVSNHIKGPPANMEVLIKRADDALYVAKAEGRNRTCYGESTAELTTASAPPDSALDKEPSTGD